MVIQTLSLAELLYRPAIRLMRQSALLKRWKIMPAHSGRAKQRQADRRLFHGSSLLLMVAARLLAAQQLILRG